MATPSAQYSLRLRIEMERGPGVVEALDDEAQAEAQLAPSA